MSHNLALFMIREVFFIYILLLSRFLSCYRGKSS